MSFPPALAPAARSAYRAVIRAGRVTFAGDLPRRAQWDNTIRQTFLSPTLTPPPSATSPTSTPPIPEENVDAQVIRKRIEEWKEVAIFLRRNVVQGTMDDTGSYNLRVTSDTEMGDNTSIRDPPKLPTTPFPNRNKRRKCGEA